MKKIKIILSVICYFLLQQIACAATIDIATFYELMNSVLQNGDVYTLTNDLDATSSINTRFYNYNINFEGQNYSIDGGLDFGGFVLGEDNSFNEIRILNSKGEVHNNSYFAGAIFNSGGETFIENSSFERNFANSGNLNFAVAGAVYNLHGGSMEISNTDFESNYTYGAGSYGGALSNGYNDNGTAQMDINNVNFASNHADGVVYAYGGALNNTGVITVDASNFENNYVNGRQESDREQPIAYGGAINNTGTMTVLNSSFDNNYGGGSSNTTTFGGAISNSGSLTFENSSINDSKVSSGQQGYGGAIFNNAGATINLKNSAITNSSLDASLSAAEGGAVYNLGTINLDSSTLKDNTAQNGTPNDIFNANSGIVNFNGTGANTILSGIDGTGTLNKNDNGTLNLGGTNSDFSGTFNFNKGTLNLLAGSSYLGSQNTNFYDGINFNMQNKEINNINFANLNVSGTANIFADMNLNNRIMDTISASSFSGGGVLHVAGLSIEGAPTGEEFVIPFADDVLKEHVTYNQTTLGTPIYNYNVSYDPASGDFRLYRDGFDSSILVSPVATQLSGYLTQLDTYRNVFSNLDMVMITPARTGTGYFLQNKIALNQNFTYSPFVMPEQQGGIWFKPYSTFESVGLKNGPRVSNVSYGSIVGVESGLKKLQNGWYGLYGAYTAYNGSHQAFDGNGIYNNGGLLGVSAAFYKGKFFSAWTVNAGATASEASTKFGNENFAMFNTGIAQMSGYNFETLKRRFIVQPALLASYTFVNTFNYKTASGVNINTRPLNAIQIEPRIKFIGNFKNYLQPYVAVSMVWNIIDSAKFQANDVYLPDLSIKPYVQYGAGIQKRWGDRVTGFFETMLRNGGRNGVILLAGFRISI